MGPGRLFPSESEAMARIAGLRRRMRVIAAVSLAVALSALAVALVVATQTRAVSRELSNALVPAAAEAGTLLNYYTTEQTSLRDYVTGGHPAALQPYRLANSKVPGSVQRLVSLVGGYQVLPGQLAAVQAAHQAWLDRVAAPELAAIRGGNLARAQVLQASGVSRPYVLGLRARVAALQAQITTEQAVATDRLRSAQRWLLDALIGTIVLVAAIVTAGTVAVRRWLLAPFDVLRQATDTVAAGDHDTHIPAVGPIELADLGRSMETMRTRLLAVLAEREAAERRFRNLLEASPDATVVVTADGFITLVNAQAEQMFGYPRHELLGQQLGVLMPVAARDPNQARRRDYLADPHFRVVGEEVALTAVHRDGREFPIEISLGPLPTEQGTVVSVAIRDISERLAAEAERERLAGEAARERYERRLAQSQRLESLGQLVGGVAHDFNNLLNVILGYSGFVEQEISDTAGDGTDSRWEPLLADVRQIHEAAQRGARLTHQLLAFGRREVTNPEVLDLNDIVSGLEQLLRRSLGEHIDLVITLRLDLWPVKADRGQLEQVLVNLAVNARDAMPTGGKLSIDTDNTLVDAAYAEGRPNLEPGRYARLRVSDTGIGMDRETLAKVFEPFFTTKQKGQGTGLGLATVYGIITQAGGHPQLYSEPGRGTTFIALLPVTDQAPLVAVDAPALPAPARGETILVVEDEESLRNMVARILRQHGYRVRVVTTATQALAEASDLEQPIDLLLTDVVMPTMLGTEVAAQMRVVRPGIRILYMSGYAHEVLHTHGTLRADLNLLEKPFTVASLLTRIRDVLDGDNDR